MKLYLVDGSKHPHRDVALDSFFGLHQGGKIVASDLSSAREGVLEGEVRHVSTQQNIPVQVCGLRTCSAVLYLYTKGAKLCDVVAFHAPSGTLNIKIGARQGEKFKKPREEASYYEIEFENVYVVIANGPETTKYAPTAKERTERISEFVQKALADIRPLLDEYLRRTSWSMSVLACFLA
ncbi:MAG: hypothetical protein JO025_21230 [Verrucomicrobia bacterium]|nr:hypothetical protein [Verrucomicrobiota bacterium]